MAYVLAQNPTAANGGGSSSISKAFASTVTAHSLLVAFVTTDATTPGTFTATGGGTWASIAAIKETSSTQWLCILYCLDATGGTAPTVQVSWTGSGTFNALLIAEFTNGGVASVHDTHTAGSLGNSTAPTDSAMSATDADAVVSWAIAGAGTNQPTVGATFTFGTNQDTTDLAAWEYKVLAGAGSVTPVFAISAAVPWGIISAAFGPAGAAVVAPMGPARPGRTWLRQFRRQFHPPFTADTAAAATAPADVATGTGTAPDVLAAVGANATEATATGSAFDATIAATANSAEAAATGSAPDAVASIAALLGSADATGSALDATVTTSGSTNASAAEATGSGSASDAVVALGVNAAEATGNGSALDAVPAATVAAAEAAATGSALDAVAAIGANAATATATGAALDATVSTSSQTNAPATEATGAGVANDATAALAVPAGAATGSGVASDAIAETDAAAGAASATGAANDATITITTLAGVAAATAAAYDATVVLGAPGSANAGVASGTGVAYDARTRKMIPRPFTGTTSRPSTGTTTRPYSGITLRP